MSYDRPRCEYCGRYVSTNPATMGQDWDGKLIWTGGVVPEPSHDVFWHLKCESKDIEKRKVSKNEQEFRRIEK